VRAGRRPAGRRLGRRPAPGARSAPAARGLRPRSGRPAAAGRRAARPQGAASGRAAAGWWPQATALLFCAQVATSRTGATAPVRPVAASWALEQIHLEI